MLSKPKIIKDNWELVSHIQSELGEGPVWDFRTNKLYWIDIVGNSIYSHNPLNGQTDAFPLEQRVGSISLTTQEHCVIAALKKGVYLIDLLSKETILIASPENNIPNNRFNDGKTDINGNFWVGSMDEVYNTKGRGSLYQIATDKSYKLLLPDLSCSNGLAWNEKYSKFYLIDTGLRILYSFDLVLEELINPHEVYHFDDSKGIPDGMTIDTEGMLWIALWNGFKIIRLDPHRKEILLEIHLPVGKVTSCTFGGDHMNDLYITTAKIGLTDDDIKKQPLAGSTFVLKNLPYKGLKTNLFKLNNSIE